MIIDDVCNGNSEPYGAEPLRELLKLLPDPDEVSAHTCPEPAATVAVLLTVGLLPQVEKLRAYRGDVSKLSMADSFVYQLVLLPR